MQVLQRPLEADPGRQLLAQLQNGAPLPETNPGRQLLAQLQNGASSAPPEADPGRQLLAQLQSGPPKRREPFDFAFDMPQIMGALGDLAPRRLEYGSDGSVRLVGLS